MAHYFGLLSVTYNEESEKDPHFKEMVEKIKLKWLLQISLNIVLIEHNNLNNKTMNQLPGGIR